jgi:hypothetical protein
MTGTPLPALTTAADYCARLGITVPAPSTLERIRMDDALADASDMLRDAIGQPLTPATDVTVPVEVNEYGYALIPFSPVTAVSAVVDSNGVTLPSDGTGYRVLGQRLNVYQQHFSYNPWAQLDPVFLVTCSHGWDPMPGELLRWVRMLAASQIAAASLGNLGMTGPVSSVAVDDGKVAFVTGPSLEIPAEHRERLRAIYGGEQP